MCLLLDIYARERGSTKQAASKACALSIVRQLFHHKLIEAFNGAVDRKETFKVSKTTRAMFSPKTLV